MRLLQQLGNLVPICGAQIFLFKLQSTQFSDGEDGSVE